MQAEGARGTTLAPQPLVSESLWAAVVTGRSAGANGVFGSIRRDGNGSPRAVSGKDLAVPPIWRLVEDAGLPVGTFNVSFADASQTATGFMVSRDARPKVHPRLVHPPEIYPRLRERFGQWTMLTMAQTKPEWTSLVPHEIETRTEVLIDLLRTRPWRFALVHLLEVGGAQHRFWNDGTGTLRSVYAAVDRAMAKLVEAVGPETIVFVFSDCGAGPIRHGVDLNAWLEQQGYLHRVRGSVQRLGLSVARAHKRARRLLPRVFDVSGFKMRVRAAIAASNVEWSRTRASSPAETSQIVFNVAARERGALADELRSRLLALRDPEGRRVVEEVIPREAWGAPRDLAPDLTIVWQDDAYMPTETFDDSGRVFVEWCPEFFDWTFTGSHRREGILLVRGPGIERTELGCVRTVDLVPTWLELLGVSIPRELEGSSLAARLSGSV
jgi:predicted AlkP superfamily phosphohydrolase/phosphomutase